MADLERLERALINADRAGDTAAARTLAQEIKRARSWTPDGNVRPGYDPAKPAAQHYGLMEAPGQEIPYGMGIAGSVSRGATFDAADEMGAAFDSVTGRAGYNESLDMRRALMNRFQKENPVASTAAEIGGAVPTALLPFMAGPRLAQGASLPGRALAGAATAGAQGGVYGFNAGEGGAENRLENAGKTAAIAGAIGAAAPAAMAGARNLADRLLTRSAAKSVGTSTPAYQIMTRAMDADGSLRGVGADNIRRAGPGAMVADAGPNSRLLLDTAVNRPGPAATVARNAVEDRASQAGRSLTGAMDDVLGAPRGVRSSARDIASQTAPARKEAYERAYAQAIDYSGDAGRNIESTLKRIPNRILRQAVDEANEAMQAAGVRNRQILVDIADDGSVAFREMPNVQQLDEIKKALGTLGAESVDQFGRKTAAGQRAAGLARQLKMAVGEAVPDYKAAVKLGGDKIERDNALRLGRDLLRTGTTREVIEEGVEDISDEAAEALRQGVRGYIDDTLANVKTAMTDTNMDAREAMKAVRELSSRASREKMARALGRADAATLYDEIRRAEAALGLRAGVAQNSKTAPRMIVDETIRAQTDDGAINAFRSGEILNLRKEGVLPRLAQTLMGRTDAAKARITDQTYSELVKMLTGPRGPEAVRMLENLAQSQARIPGASENYGRLAERLMRANTAVTGPTR